MMNKDSLIALCVEIEGAMKNHIEAAQPEQIQAQLGNLVPYLANLSTMVSYATQIYDDAKGKAAQRVINSSKLIDLKAGVMSKWFEGELSDENALFVRVETLSKNLRTSVEGLRSMLSYEKELVNLHKQNPEGR